MSCDDELTVALRHNFETAASSVVEGLQHMTQHFESRVTTFKKEVELSSSAPQHRSRRQRILKEVVEGASSIEECLNQECRKLDQQEPLLVFRQQVQERQNSDQQRLEGLLDHLQSLALDLDAIPSVAKWRGCSQQQSVFPGECSMTDLMTRVARSFEESPLAQHSSRSVFDVAHSPAMGIVDASVSGNAITAFSRTHDGDAYPSENGPGVLHPGSVTSTHVEPAPRIKNWAVLQEQNEKLAAILAQHDIKLNTDCMQPVIGSTGNDPMSHAALS